MSNRSSFVTEFIYCEECLNILDQEINKNKHIHAQRQGSIISGTFKGIGSDDFMLHEIADKIKLCHAVRIAVITEDEGIQEVIAGE